MRTDHVVRLCGGRDLFVHFTGITGDGYRSLADLPGRGPCERFDTHRDDPAIWLFSGGTTGAPKAAMLTHGNLLSNLEQCQDHPGRAQGPDDVVLGHGSHADPAGALAPERRPFRDNTRLILAGIVVLVALARVTPSDLAGRLLPEGKEFQPPAVRVLAVCTALTVLAAGCSLHFVGFRWRYGSIAWAGVGFGGCARIDRGGPFG